MYNLYSTVISKYEGCADTVKTVADPGFRVVALPCKNTFLKFPFTGTEVEAQIWNGCI